MGYKLAQNLRFLIAATARNTTALNLDEFFGVMAFDIDEIINLEFLNDEIFETCIFLKKFNRR
ncbi:MAG: hypothetical protein LBJ32_04415 [Oscillospiraceae bacterium]|nr:hypothetical protein [Oscillospiraceae bacterium]